MMTKRIVTLFFEVFLRIYISFLHLKSFYKPIYLPFKEQQPWLFTSVHHFNLYCACGNSSQIKMSQFNLVLKIRNQLLIEHGLIKLVIDVSKITEITFGIIDTLEYSVSSITVFKLHWNMIIASKNEVCDVIYVSIVNKLRFNGTESICYQWFETISVEMFFVFNWLMPIKDDEYFILNRTIESIANFADFVFIWYCITSE
jgi:hypothetical protein